MDAFVWLPFWRELAEPFAFAGVAATQLDALFAGRLPRGSRSVAGVGLLLCVADRVRSLLATQETPSQEITFEDGASICDVPSGRLQLSWTCASMRGWRPSMEDTHIAAMMPCHDGHVGVFCVFDGHGGWQVSSIAQALFPKLFADRLCSITTNKNNVGTVLEDTVLELDSALLAGPCGIGRLFSLQWFHPFSWTGATSCAVIVDAAQGKLIVANTGDSRAILSREGNAVALSHDHKPENADEFARIYRAGGNVVRMGPCYRVDGGLNLSRALGDFGYKSNSSLPASEQKVVANPDIITEEWRPFSSDSFLLVACDGLFERKNRQEVVDHVQEGLRLGQTPREVLQDLLLDCCARSPYQPGQDNETAILVRWQAAN